MLQRKLILLPLIFLLKLAGHQTNSLNRRGPVVGYTCLEFR